MREKSLHFHLIICYISVEAYTVFQHSTIIRGVVWGGPGAVAPKEKEKRKKREKKKKNLRIKEGNYE